MKSTITFLFIVSFLHARCQGIDEAFALFQQRKYKEAMDMARKLIYNPVTEANACDLIGRIFVTQSMGDSAIPYLQKSIAIDKDSTYISGWSHVYLGQAYIIIGKKEMGVNELNEAIKLNKTANSVDFAKHVLASVSEDSRLMPNCVTIESEHFVFKFQDTSSWGKRVNTYISQHEKAYVKINETFNAVLPRKITFYTWNDPELAKNVLGRDLGFTNPQMFTCNVDYRQTIGHELTHVLSYWGWGTGMEPGNTNRLINEGVAVAFDVNKVDKYENAKKIAAVHSISSIIDVWKDGRLMEANVLYPLGGAFVTYLYKNSSPEQFKSIIKDQTIENAQKTYRIVEFGRKIKEFDDMIGLH